MTPDLQRRLCAAARRGLNGRREDQFLVNVARLLYGDVAVGLTTTGPSHRRFREDQLLPEVPMTMIKARFYIAEMTRFPGQGGGSICLRPVTRGARNATWSAATPSGELRMTITNVAAYNAFAARMDETDTPEYEITFEPVNVPRMDDGHEFEAVPEGHYASNACALCNCIEFDLNGKPTHKTA